MSTVALRSHRALSFRPETVCSTCLKHVQRSEGREPLRSSTSQPRRTYVDWKNIEHPEWRKQAVKRLNARKPEDIPQENYTTNPRTKDGFLGPNFYSAESSFPPISIEPLPKVDLDTTPEDRRDLDSTRPAPLDEVTRSKDEKAFSYYLRLGKSFLKFYKTGMKNIKRNWTEYREIKGWLQPFTIGGSARYGGTPHQNKDKEMIPIPHISRREYILSFRTRHDVFKLLPFGLVLLICGEFTPLVVLLLGNKVTPYTCRIPSQQRKNLDKALQRFRTYQREMRRLTEKSVPSPRHTFDFQPPSRRVEHPWRRDALFAHLVDQTSFSTLPFPLTANLFWHSTLQPRLSAYWDRIFCDTLLIKRSGGFTSLSPQDIFEYALNYGCLSLFVIMQYEISHRKNYDFVNESLKKRLVPILEAEADVMLDEDFTRLHPSMHWARAYRDSTRWGTHTPDIQGALRLMREFGMEWSTDRESWGGNWKFNRGDATPAITDKNTIITNAISEKQTTPEVSEPIAFRQQQGEADDKKPKREKVTA